MLQESDFSYARSSQVNLPVQIQVDSPILPYLVLEIVHFNNHVVGKRPVLNRDWLKFDIKYSELLLSSIVRITMYEKKDRSRIPIKQGLFTLFNKKNVLKQSRHRILLNPMNKPENQYQRTEIDGLDKLMRRYKCGDIPHVDWLDDRFESYFGKVRLRDTIIDGEDFVYINLPIFDFPIIYHEVEYKGITLRSLRSPLISVIDPDVLELENPVESKHRKLARSYRTGPLDKNLKPNSKLRDELNVILNYPPTQIFTEQEKDLLWRFRFYLLLDKKPLAKFVKCVVWKDPVEAKQAIELLEQWGGIDVEDALELLGSGSWDSKVRAFAVAQLHRAESKKLLLYLLQLVQAIKFETDKSDSPLVKFLIGRGLEDHALGNYFHWYLMIECQDKTFGRMYANVAFQFLAKMVQTSQGINRRDNLRRQAELIEKLANLCKDIRLSKESRPKKIEQLQSFISDPRNGLLSFPPLSLPLDPDVQVTGIVPEKAFVFKSNLSPLSLTFTCIDGSEYGLIFKHGDDLRQDQLVVQLFSLMDKLLLKENLNLKLSPYKVLATAPDHGMIQFLTGKNIASILRDCQNSLVPYLEKDGVIEKGVMDNYIKSLAGYCVMTFLLGVGDRHLDNILLKQDGCVFHIDFGFILGRDPKFFPPPMKISKEILEVMGGTTSARYTEFKSFCFVAYNNLRKSANLILNLFNLMSSANIPDIALEAEKAVFKVLITDRFKKGFD